MTTLDELLRAHARLTEIHVERWVERGLLRPSAESGSWVFEPVDVARACLLVDLSEDMGFDEDAIETVVGLLDQVHTLRRQLDRLGRAIGRQPVAVREAIAAALKEIDES
ncbi:MAG: hypothetical protein FJX11_19040 [Alphaproteobacteria bacterium]|nr:hypothetical protein [Alphaproteobacteria bacterium]